MQFVYKQDEVFQNMEGGESRSSAGNCLTFKGCNYLRQRLILSILSGKAIIIKNIRDKDDNPGLREFESNLFSLLEEITKGSTLQINTTGTTLRYSPGMLSGGKFQHACNLERGIGYYLEVLVCLAPFTKEPTQATLTGITNSQLDPSVDLVKSSVMPLLKRFLGTDEGLDLKITKRGVAPLGGGEIVFRCPTRQKLRPIQYVDCGKVRRIRGVAWAINVSPMTCNKMVESARGILNKCLPDIYIYTDHRKRDQAGKSPGYGIALVAETTNGSFLAAEACSHPPGSPEGRIAADDLGVLAARKLLEEIYKGGCVDTPSQSVACLMMTLGDQDVSKLQTGPLSTYTIHFLRHIRDYFGLVFKIDVEQRKTVSADAESDDDDNELRLGGDKILLTCTGIGFRNLSKVIL